MAGAMWQLASGLSAEIQFVPGYSFNSVASSDKSAVRAQVAVPQAVTDIGNSFAWETRLALWREMGLHLELTKTKGSFSAPHHAIGTTGSSTVG
jgi:hypothetical protein